MDETCRARHPLPHGVIQAWSGEMAHEWPPGVRLNFIDVNG